MFLNFLRKIKRWLFKSSALIEVNIYREAILNNLHEYQKAFASWQFMPVLKSNAYGHGLLEIASILKRETVPFLVVDSLFEAKTLRHNGVKLPILIVGFLNPKDIVKNKLKNIAITIVGLEQLKEVAENLKKPVNFHLMVDTGMHRQGIRLQNIKEAINIIKSNPNFILQGLCSHLADAENENSEFTLGQISVWNETVEVFKSAFPAIKYFHLAATSGMKYFEKINANAARLGIGLYGFETDPLPESKFLKAPLSLQSALEVKSSLSSIREIQAGEFVGYGATFKAKEKMKIATVPIGYFEGVDRRLSNQGSFIINNQSCPIVGRVSMNITSIDVSAVPNAKMGDEVIVISKKLENANSAPALAKLSGALIREIFIHIPAHLRRIVL